MPTLSAISLRRLAQRFAAARDSPTITTAATAAATTATATTATTAATATTTFTAFTTASAATAATSTTATGAAPWLCPSPEQLHHELASRWSVRYLVITPGYYLVITPALSNYITSWRRAGA